MSQTSIQILTVSQITLPPLPHIPSPMKLSFFDSIWIGIPPIQRLMLYSNPNVRRSFQSLAELLKSSLSATLVDYLPLAGKLTHVSSTGDVEIDFSDMNVSFIEAEADFDIRQLTASEIHDVGSFKKLVPEIDVSVLPFPIFAVQVTIFKCGGIAVGYSVHHTVVDGKALLQFVQAWTSACRAKMHGVNFSVHKPLYDRVVIKHPKGEEMAREFFRNSTPHLPNTRSSSIHSDELQRSHLIRRTFIVDAASIQSLKQRATTQQQVVPSTFVSLSAHVWISISRTRSFDPNTELAFGFLMDCRSRLNPPISDDYFGTCVRGVLAKCMAGELTGEQGLVKACTSICKSIDEVSKDPVSDWEGWIAAFESLSLERFVNVTASPRFRVYEADFGWGAPDRFESVSMNLNGEFALVGGREEGTVQVSVSLDEGRMEKFAQLFLGGLSGFASPRNCSAYLSSILFQTEEVIVQS